MRLDTEKPANYICQTLDFRRDVFEKIVIKDSDQIWLKASLKDVKKVVIIASASRSGSSLLFAILNKIPRVYSLSGESVPFYKLNGLSSYAFASDEIPQEVSERRDYWFGLSRDFLSDFTLSKYEDDIFKVEKMLEQYIDSLALRFPLQWPGVFFSYEIFMRLARQAYEAYLKTHKRFCKEEFYLELIWFLRLEYKTINPYYYDIPCEMIQRKFPKLKIPSGPPFSAITIEEPPFILLSPAKKVSESDLSEKILLLKSSADSYRLSFFETLFPYADIKIIYLTRNPAASINGLYDGWLHRGFFSHNLSAFLKTQNSGSKMLEIVGYSDCYEWGKWWWKYDLPGGWQDYTQKHLEEVCAFQWLSANKAIRGYLKKSQKKYCWVKYENMISNLELRKKEINKILDFMGLGSEAIEQLSLDKLPIVQATQVPRVYRWKKRKNIILPLLEDSKIYEMAAELGYDKNNNEEWL